MACLDDTTLAQLVEGSVPAASRAALEGHIDSCRECYELVTRYAQAYLSQGTGELAAGGAPPSLLRGDSVGRYVVLDCIGMGSMGTVYSAFDPELDRRVALKLLRVASDAGGGWREIQPRLLREARALAQLSHPNVVTIHDVGTLTDRVFITTELVEGCTLRQWLGERARGLQEVLDVFLAAGEGLAAAHAAGIVHRDFKPDNVLVGADGRVRVADFGMARMFAGEDPERLASDDPAALAVTGVLLGTPAYMAPEQHDGRPADARSDLFSFCVALFEAVCGARPFAGRTLEELADHVRRGEMRAPAPTMPSWLAAIVIRGLAVAPAARHRDMRALLDALRHTPVRRTRRRWIAAAALVLVATASGAYVLARGGAPDVASTLCRGAPDKLQGVWDEKTRAAAQAAFAATKAPYAVDAWASVRQAVDAHAAAWTAAYTENCLATRARGEQSEAVMDLRVACLERNLGELRALTGLLAEADAEVVLAATDMSHALAGVDSCNDIEALQARVRPDSERPEAAAIADEIATARALRRAGKFARASTHAEAALARARELELAWLAADAQVELGHVRLDLAEDLALAEQTVVDGVWAAEAAGNVDVAADGWISLVEIRRARADYPGADEAARRADAAIHHLGDDLRAAHLASHVGQLHSARGEYDAAIASYEKALAGFAALGPGEEIDAARVQGNIGAALSHQGHHERAVAAFRGAGEVLERSLGAEHPDVVTYHNNTAAALSRLGRRREAVALFRQVLAARERAFGRGHPRTLPVLQNLATVQGELGERHEAQALLRQVLAIQERTLGPEHPNLGTTLQALGLMMRGLGDIEGARANLERALAVQERGLGPDHPIVATTLNSLGSVQMDARDFAAALVSYTRALQIRRAHFGPDHELVGRVMSRLGTCQRRLGQLDAAIANLERAVEILARGADPFGPLEARNALAIALWHQPGQRPRGAKMWVELRDQVAGMQDVPPDFRETVAGWFAKHPETEALSRTAAAAR